MNCPNCDSPGLRTVETFQLHESTLRTKRCPACKWLFTSKEVVTEDTPIPREVRRAKVSKNVQEQHA